MTVPENPEAAEAVVRKIATDHGYLSPEEFLKIPDPATRRKFEESYLRKDLLIGSSVITLAKNLYASKARFVFELLQNADDNVYTRAKALGQDPYVLFKVYHEKIVLECNEDGFTTENLEAICSVGRSSKAAAHGYIGEKGIGFKSVFMAAKRVHIQSGPFSFAFAHSSGDSGMGMISPTWVETTEVLKPPMTRITMGLHRDGDAKALASLRDSIHKQLSEIQETFLLFMRNLKNVKVICHDKDGDEISYAEYAIAKIADVAHVERTLVNNGEKTKSTKYYHVTCHEVKNLPKHDNRVYTSSQSQTADQSKSEIVLAFPVSEASIPITNITQNLFVFLPVRPVGFNFVIHADFVTDANRQDILKDSLRNVALLDGVADAFVKAVLRFCAHDTLKYQWMRYLPEKNENSWEPMWYSLELKIVDRVRSTAVAFGRKSPQMRFIKDLCWLDPSEVDQEGQPLLDDCSPGEIISPQYKSQDLDRLKDWGLPGTSFKQILRWLRRDLISGWFCRMRSAETSDDWHTRVAKLLRHRSQSAQMQVSLRKWKLIPLEDGTWVSASSGSVYLASTGTMNIPSQISLRSVARSVTNVERLKLFKHLGVLEASIPFVRKQILSTYEDARDAEVTVSFDLAVSKEHLKFLYLTEHSRAPDEDGYENLTLITCDGSPVSPFSDYVFIDNDDSYGPREMFRKTDPGPRPGDGAPGHDECFLNREYFLHMPAPAKGQSLTWFTWLCDNFELERYVNFDYDVNRTYVEQHRPEKFLKGLQLFHRQSNDTSLEYLDDIRNTKVLCRNDLMVPFKNTYFATIDLERRVKRFVEPGSFFPWLWMDEESTLEVVPSEWNDLFNKFGRAGLPVSDLNMALDMLKYSVGAFPDAPSPQAEERLFNLYDYIFSKYKEHESHGEAQGKINNFFLEGKYIYIPLPSGQCSWVSPNDCVWKAPRDMRFKYALHRLYKPYFDPSTSHRSLEQFFTSILGVADCTWETYVGELKVLKAIDCADIDIIHCIYSALSLLVVGRTIDSLTSDCIRLAFEEEALIYYPSTDGVMWYKVSQCVWSNAATLWGRVSLNGEYGDLEDLLVKFLGVKPVDLPMAIDELKDAGGREAVSVIDVKTSIWTVNSLLSVESDPPKPGRLLKYSIFPVKFPNGSTHCRSLEVDFFVADREILWKSLFRQVKFLDFTFEEVVQLAPFLEWVGLDKKYLSRCARESTSFDGSDDAPLLNADRQIRNRAYALLRVAAHFGSPRTKRGLEAFYDELRYHVNILGTDKIVSQFHLSQDAKSYTVEGKRTTLFIRECELGATIYLPRNKDDQDYAFTKLLAPRLFEWMMEDKSPQGSDGANKQGIDATRDVLTAPRSRLATALDDNGIAGINISNEDEEAISESETSLAPQGLSEDLAEAAANSDDNGTDELVYTPPSIADVVSASSRYSSVQPILRPLRSELFSLPERPGASVIDAPSRHLTGDSDYVELLTKVIAAAHTGSIPGLRQPRANDNTRGNRANFRLSCASQIERDRKIGAAGELYVFELLSHLRPPSGPLPQFTRAEWKSNIRDYVNVHPNYSDLEPYRQPETSDIVYTDVSSVLTNLFIEKGHLARERWEGKTPKYYIEVKTTVSVSEAPFYMSRAQYERMGRNVLVEDNDHTIYVIFRVYNLGREDLSLDVYLDPEMMKNQELIFSADTWSVVPTNP